MELALPKSDWEHLVDPSERRDDLAHTDDFSNFRRRLVDDYGMDWQQATEFGRASLEMPESERFEDVNEIINDEIESP